MSQNQIKFCHKCKTEKNLSDFNKDITRVDGLYPQCKICRNAKASKIRKYRRQTDPLRHEKDKESCRKSFKKHRVKRLAYMKEHRNAEYSQNYNLQYFYGITLEDYNLILKKQKGVCAICGKEETRKNKYAGICKLHVDHDHKTDKVRGLLCCKCNFSLGGFNDDLKILQRAIKYIKKSNS